VYFEREPQLCEALPDRLRGLIDLADQARLELARRPSEETKAKARELRPYAPASRIVEAIWQHAARSSPVPLAGYREVVRVHEGTGAININISGDPPEMELHARRVAQSISANGSARPIVSVLSMNRIEARIGSGNWLPRSVTAALMLAADVSSDQNDSDWNVPTTDRDGYDEAFAYSEYQPQGASTMRFGWPLPAGLSFPFYSAISSRWKEKVHKILGKRSRGPAEIAPEEADDLAKYFLFLSVYLSPTPNASYLGGAKALEWDTLAECVVDLMRRGPTAWRRWALRRAGILAAPEYGLSVSGATDWLKALRRRTGEEWWPRVCAELVGERWERMMAVADTKEPQRLANEIDEALSDHVWGQQVAIFVDVERMRVSK
jgi:hypothetical protein